MHCELYRNKGSVIPKDFIPDNADSGVHGSGEVLVKVDLTVGWGGEDSLSPDSCAVSTKV